MGTLSGDNLTAGYAPDLEASISASAPGMAHFANTGPSGTACHQCLFWGKSNKFRRINGALAPRRCLKFKSLSGGFRVKRGIPAEVPSCRHYSPRLPAPPVFSRRHDPNTTPEGQ